MKINLIGKNFDKNSGQGIYKYSGELLSELKKTRNIILTNLDGEINHVQQPELIWKVLFKKKIITTIHDIIPIVYGERKFLFRVFFYFSVFLALIKSKKVIVDSISTKKDLIKYFSFAKDKITPIYLGTDDKKFYPLKKRNNKKFTIGYIGGLGKRKNVEIILRIAKETEKENILFKIAGKGPELKKLLELKKKLNLKNIEFVGFVPENKINAFYNSLNLFIFPSFYEGFGLPVLEAMACGIPVITSNRSSLPEVVGNAGILINPNSIIQIKNAIEKVINNKKLQKEMARKSLIQTSKFSWEKTVSEYLKVIRDIQ